MFPPDFLQTAFLHNVVQQIEECDALKRRRHGDVDSMTARHLPDRLPGALSPLSQSAPQVGSTFYSAQRSIADVSNSSPARRESFYLAKKAKQSLYLLVSRGVATTFIEQAFFLRLSLSPLTGPIRGRRHGANMYVYRRAAGIASSLVQRT